MERIGSILFSPVRTMRLPQMTWHDFLTSNEHDKRKIISFFQQGKVEAMTRIPFTSPPRHIPIRLPLNWVTGCLSPARPWQSGLHLQAPEGRQKNPPRRWSWKSSKSSSSSSSSSSSLTVILSQRHERQQTFTHYLHHRGKSTTGGSTYLRCSYCFG